MIFAAFMRILLGAALSFFIGSGYHLIVAYKLHPNVSACVQAGRNGFTRLFGFSRIVTGARRGCYV